MKGQVRVSRTYPLCNRLLIRGTKAQAEIPSDDPDTVVIRRQIGQGHLSETLRLPDFPHTTTFYKQLDNFVESIRGNQKLVSNGWQALRVIELINGATPTVEESQSHGLKLRWDQMVPFDEVAQSNGFRHRRNRLHRRTDM